MGHTILTSCYFNGSIHKLIWHDSAICSVYMLNLIWICGMWATQFQFSHHAISMVRLLVNFSAKVIELRLTFTKGCWICRYLETFFNCAVLVLYSLLSRCTYTVTLHDATPQLENKKQICFSHAIREFYHKYGWTCNQWEICPKAIVHLFLLNKRQSLRDSLDKMDFKQLLYDSKIV